MSHYRDDREATRARIEALEAQILELTAALESRDAELAALRSDLAVLRQGPNPLRGPSWAPMATVFACAALVVGLISAFSRNRPTSASETEPEPAPLKVVTVADLLPSAVPLPTTPAPRPAAPAPEEPTDPAHRAVKLCYSAELPSRPNLSGALTVRATWSDAHLTKVLLDDSPVRSATFDACVKKALLGREVQDTSVPVEIGMDFVFSPP